MDKYSYRKHLRGSFLNYFVAISIFFSFIVLGVLGIILSEGTRFNYIDFGIILYIMAIVFIVLLLEFIVIYFLLLRRFKYINVTLTNEAIIYKNKKKEILIPYDDIIEIKYPSVKYTAGWMKIKYKGGKIRLTVVLENIGDFMYQLKTILDSRGKNNVYNEKKSFSFFKTASFSDEGWDRMYKNVKYIIGMEYLTLLIMIALAFFGITKNGGIFGGIFAPITGYVISELIIGSKVSKRVINGEYKLVPRNVSKEHNIIRIGCAISTILFILVTIFIK